MKKQTKKLKILAAADLHGSKDIAERLAEKAEKNHVDLVVLAGDLHGAFEGGDVIAPFKKRKQKVVTLKERWLFPVVQNNPEKHYLFCTSKQSVVDGIIKSEDIDLTGIFLRCEFVTFFQFSVGKFGN